MDKYITLSTYNHNDYNLFIKRIRFIVKKYLKEKNEEKEKDLKTIALAFKAIVGMIDKLNIIKDVNTLVSEINNEKEKNERKDEGKDD